MYIFLFVNEQMPILFHNSYWNQLRSPIYLETGLLQGKSLLKAYKSQLFTKCISIEISKKHVDDFFKNNKPIPKSIKVIHGNSNNLSEYIAPISQPITFFLDAHDDQRFTKERRVIHDDPGTACPLFEELEAIYNHPIKGHKIMVDDMQCFKKDHQHPRHDWFKNIKYPQIIIKIKELFPNYAMYMLDSYRPGDVLVAIPEETSIPKIIHMTYKDAKSLPELFKTCKEKAKQFYTDFEIMFHSDKDIESFMTEHFPEFKRNVFDKLPLKIMKLDVFRYCLLDVYGGLYLDMDHELIRRHPFLKADLFLCLDREKKEGDTHTLIGNSIIASKPNNPFWKFLRDVLETQLPGVLKIFQQKKNIIMSQTKDRKNFVIDNTGPKFLTNVYEKFKTTTGKDNNIKLVSRKVFHGPKAKTPVELNKLLDGGVQCGFHHCAGTWHKSRN
jgi:mannosyltransferase OCH1-like enzyme